MSASSSCSAMRAARRASARSGSKRVCPRRHPPVERDRRAVRSQQHRVHDHVAAGVAASLNLEGHVAIADEAVAIELNEIILQQLRELSPLLRSCLVPIAPEHQPGDLVHVETFVQQLPELCLALGFRQVAAGKDRNRLIGEIGDERLGWPLCGRGRERRGEAQEEDQDRSQRAHGHEQPHRNSTMLWAAAAAQTGWRGLPAILPEGERPAWADVHADAGAAADPIVRILPTCKISPYIVYRQ